MVLESRLMMIMLIMMMLKMMMIMMIMRETFNLYSPMESMPWFLSAVTKSSSYVDSPSFSSGEPDNNQDNNYWNGDDCDEDEEVILS